MFDRFVGVDYSGARTAESGLPGIRVFVAEGERALIEVLPVGGRSKYWSRRGLAEWLVAELDT